MAGLLLYSVPRVGGTSITKSLNVGVEDKEFLEEPLHIRIKKGHSESEREKVVYDLLSQVNKSTTLGFRYNPRNLKRYPASCLRDDIPVELDKKIVDFFSDKKVLVLDRENLLRRVFSFLLAIDTRIFQRFRGSKDDKDDFSHSGISLRNVKRMIDYYNEFWMERKKYVLKTCKNVRYLTYEEFYNGRSFKERVECIKNLIEWTGNTFNRNGSFEKWLSRDGGKLNSEERYRNVENAEVINKVFGPGYGYLFPPENE